MLKAAGPETLIEQRCGGGPPSGGGISVWSGGDMLRMCGEKSSRQVPKLVKRYRMDGIRPQLFINALYVYKGFKKTLKGNIPEVRSQSYTGPFPGLVTFFLVYVCVTAKLV